MWQDIVQDIDIYACIVYIALLSHRHTVTNKCFPSMALLAEETKLDIKTVSEKITLLNDLGYIDKLTQKGQSNRYFFPKEDFYNNFSEDEQQRFAHSLKYQIVCDEWEDDKDCPF